MRVRGNLHLQVCFCSRGTISDVGSNGCYPTSMRTPPSIDHARPYHGQAAACSGSASHLLPRFPTRWSGGQIPKTYSSHGSLARLRPAASTMTPVPPSKPRPPCEALPPLPTLYIPPSNCTTSKAVLSFSLSRLRSSCPRASQSFCSCWSFVVNHRLLLFRNPPSPIIVDVNSQIA